MNNESRLKTIAKIGSVLINTSSLHFGDFKTSGGNSSSYYLDLRSLPSFPNEFKFIISAYIETLKEKQLIFDSIAAIPTAGLTYGMSISYDLMKPLIYVRTSTKSHGLMKQIEGRLNSGQRVLIVDDLITSGGSILNSINAIRSAGGIVTDALVLIDRLEMGSSLLAQHNVKLISITDINELAKIMNDSDLITNDQFLSIQKQSGKP